MHAKPAERVPWKFRSPLRRNAFGWRGSRPAIKRIDEALAEIRAAARRDPVLGAEGAVIFLEKISPALCQVDSSSGALGGATHWAVKELVPIIAAAAVSEVVRSRWLDRLFQAIQEDDPPYIESLGDHWGELCVTPALASHWADALMPGVKRAYEERRRGTFVWFNGTSPCYSALFTAGRHDELLALLSLDPHPSWSYSEWGGRVLAARGQPDEAIAYVVSHAGINTPMGALARFAEQALLDAGRRAEAYERYGIEANQANSRLATYRAIAKKYPEIEPERLLPDLIASRPGEEGKWFATAKSLGRLDLALSLARRSPCDPKTLTRAARDHLAKHPAFALEAALAALYWMSEGHGYELTAMDAHEAYRHALGAAERIGQTERVAQRVRQFVSRGDATARWLREALGLVGESGQG